MHNHTNDNTVLDLQTCLRIVGIADDQPCIRPAKTLRRAAGERVQEDPWSSCAMHDMGSLATEVAKTLGRAATKVAQSSRKRSSSEQSPDMQ